MTKTNGLVLAAFLMASTSPMAFAQTTPPTPGADSSVGTDTTTAPGASSSVGTGATGTTGMATGSASADVDMERSMLITSLTLETGDKDWNEEFSNLSDDVEVKIVTMSELKEADTASTGTGGLDQAISNLEDGRSDLRSAIESHDTLKSALEDEDYSADDVVAAVIQPGIDNEVTLIVDADKNND